MRIVVKDLMAKAPKPDEMDAYGPDEEKSSDSEDEDADSAAAMSTMEDYIRAVKSGNTKESLDLFKELVSYCK